MSRSLANKYVDYLILESPLLEGRSQSERLLMIAVLRQAAKEFETFNAAVNRELKNSIYEIKKG